MQAPLRRPDRDADDRGDILEWPFVDVVQGEDRALLDRQAVDTMRRATAATPIPPALRNREIVVEIPLLYELKTES